MEQHTESVPRLELRHASKTFGRVRALSDGELVLWPGEVHALLGENGAGKSTLVKILAGVHQPDTGELRIDGNERRFATPAEARDVRIEFSGRQAVWLVCRLVACVCIDRRRSERYRERRALRA